MAYTATHKYARISARKVRHLASLVRGKFADEALDILRFQPHRGARMLEKVIKSALGNAEHQQAPGVDDLVVTDARVDAGLSISLEHASPVVQVVNSDKQHIWSC